LTSINFLLFFVFAISPSAFLLHCCRCRRYRRRFEAQLKSFEKVQQASY